MLQKQFENYLSSRGISPKSIKNYKSDLSNFIAWAIKNLKSYGSYVENLTELVPFLSPKLISEYKFHLQTDSPVKTLNRRLSTLRSLSKFLISSQIIDNDFMEKIQNINLQTTKPALKTHSLLKDFIAHLTNQNISKNTIKNYSSDVRQFLTWLENNHAQSA